MDLDLNKAKPNECFLKLDKTLSFAWIGPFLSSRANGYFLEKCSFFELLHQKSFFFELLHQKSFSSFFTRKEDIRLGTCCCLLYMRSLFWRSTTGFSQANRFAQKSSFLNFWCTFSLSHQLNVLIFSFLSTSLKLKQILWDYIMMETLPLVKYCKPSNFQIKFLKFSSFQATSSRYACFHISKGFSSSSFRSFFLFLFLSIICIVFVLFCAFLFSMFFFSLFYRHWQFSRPDESPVDWRLDRLDRHSLNTTRSRWARLGKYSREIQSRN